MSYKKIFAFASVFAAISAFLAFISFKNSYKQHFDTVSVAGGKISGTTNAAGDIHIFKGIPFAAAPVGDFRWRAPQPVQPWTGIKKCDAFGASPIQNSPVPFGPWSVEYLIPKEPISEDCLYLNVWTGAGSPKEKKPVLVWIYGGGFTSGGAGVPVYDGEAMAKKGIVFVSVNYRVGVFGFFAHPDLTKESGHHASGNYGLMDQIAGIQWVKKNISAFGGDPENMTIAGQSVGSMSVNCLVASPLCKGMFKRAIAESGASFLTGPEGKTKNLKEAESDGVQFARSLQTNSIAELRKIPADELLKTPFAGRGPIIDGYLLPQSIAGIFAANKQNDVGLLTGWNEDDGVVFGKLKNADEMKAGAAQLYGADASRFLQLYPANNDAEAASSQADVSRDMIFGMQNYTWANLQADKSRYQVWLYRFTRRLPATGEYTIYGAFHTGEVAYAYDNLHFVTRCPWEPADYTLAKTMSSYWANFAATGNPNRKDLPEWPAYNTKNFPTMMLGAEIKAESLPGREGLDFLIGHTR
jgi:para-nitrobenzyl esterase